MSAVVFAGGAQFAALGMLGPPSLMAPIMLATFAINARHLLLGASLAPWLASLTLWQRLGSVTVLSDVNWAQSMRAHAAGERDAGVLVGAGALMWSVWVLGTLFGAVATQAVPDIRRFGLDALMLGFFSAALADGWRGRGDLPAAAGAAVITVIASVLGAREWSVIAGALAGAALGTWSDEHAC
jgi:predicted branched-subunit amino acid permease